MIHCFYHNDLDGHCAGAIVKTKFPNCEMHEVAYGVSFAKHVLPHIKEGDSVYVVDFSFSEEEMKILNTMCDLHWCDHHGKKLPFKVQGLQDTKEAGCALTWKYLMKDQPMPLVVRLVSNYDIWDHSDFTCVLFAYGMEFFTTDPGSKDGMRGWKDLFKNSRVGDNKHWNTFDQVLSLGSVSADTKALMYSRMMKASYLIPNFTGLKCVVVNAQLEDSYAFNPIIHVFKDFDPDALMWYYQLPNGRWKYAIRTFPGKDTNVRTIAEMYNGGGHEHAAGFTLNFAVKPVFRSLKWARLIGTKAHSDTVKTVNV